MGFSKVYYSELRRLVSKSEALKLADWVKGERITDVYACLDGVIVVQVYPDNIPPDATLKYDEDGNLFRFDAAKESLVKDLFPSAIPPRPGGGGWPQLRYPDYESGRPFGSHVTLTHLIVYHDLDGKHYVSQEARLWSRVEYADMARSVKCRLWSNTVTATVEAQEAVRLARISKKG